MTENTGQEPRAGASGAQPACPASTISQNAHYLGCVLPPDQKLEAEGWQRRFIFDVQRTDELIESYHELGFEVRVEPVSIEQVSEACADCQIVFKNFGEIYTRKKSHE